MKEYFRMNHKLDVKKRQHAAIPVPLPCCKTKQKTTLRLHPQNIVTFRSLLRFLNCSYATELSHPKTKDKNSAAEFIGLEMKHS